jgi:transglutaminase-like putative cysteine protease
MRRIQIQHSTAYRYREPVTLLEHRLLLRPREGHDIRIESSRLDITPAYHIIWRRDIYGNSVGHVSFDAATDRLVVTSDVVVQHYEDQPLDFVIDETAEHLPFRYDPMEQVDLMPYQLAGYPQDNSVLAEWVGKLWRRGEIVATRELLDRLNHAVVADIEYAKREEPGVQPPVLTLTRGKGSCRDSANLFIEACRYCGLAARFVSGYLLSSASVQDYGTTHAWSEIYLPGSGWVGYDSTSGQPTGPDHIAVAVNRRPDAVPPISGAFIGPRDAKPVMEVECRVQLL